jgi:hypothetical protein
MSIDFLQDIERAIDHGTEIYACPGLGRNQWEISKSIEQIMKVAKRVATNKKSEVKVMMLAPSHQHTTDVPLLVPTKIRDNSDRGTAQIDWTVVETKDAAETLRDVSQGPSPYFCLSAVETIKP